MLKKPKITSRQNTNVSKNGTFQIVEAYKNIRTGLLFALSTTKEKSIVCTSAEPGAGKSTSCSNVAITMAQTGAKVVLIDADMRKPTQHKIFRVSNSQGLSKLLSGLAPLKDSIQRDVVTNLDLIPSGPIPPNPSELLGSENMLLLLEQLSQQYDYVLWTRRRSTWCRMHSCWRKRSPASCWWPGRNRPITTSCKRPWTAFGRWKPTCWAW